MIRAISGPKSRKACHPRSISNSFEELTQKNIETIAQLEQAEADQRSTLERGVDAVARFCGTLPFVWVHILWFGIWLATNAVPGIQHFDPFPFPLLTLIISMEAIFLTTFVLISQNNQSRISERRNHLDLQINLLAEQENSKMIKMLNAIMGAMNVTIRDTEADAMQEDTQPEKIAAKIVDTIEQPSDPTSSGRTTEVSR